MSANKIKARRLTGAAPYRVATEVAQLGDEVARQGSEDRCLDSFENWYGEISLEDWNGDSNIGLLYLGWKACWKYLERRALEEFRS